MILILHLVKYLNPLVARRRSVGKPLGLPCGAYATTKKKAYQHNPNPPSPSPNPNLSLS